ncbi:MAG: hypothetical protein ACLGI6_18395 [Gammaproteobacteria bacterium]
MKICQSVVSVVGFVLAMLLVSATFLAEQFPQAAEAQSVGFDALAHSIFDGSGERVAEGEAQ